MAKAVKFLQNQISEIQKKDVAMNKRWQQQGQVDRLQNIADKDLQNLYDNLCKRIENLQLNIEPKFLTNDIQHEGFNKKFDKNDKEHAALIAKFAENDKEHAGFNKKFNKNDQEHTTLIAKIQRLEREVANIKDTSVGFLFKNLLQGVVRSRSNKGKSGKLFASIVDNR